MVSLCSDTGIVPAGSLSHHLRNVDIRPISTRATRQFHNVYSRCWLLAGLPVDINSNSSDLVLKNMSYSPLLQLVILVRTFRLFTAISTRHFTRGSADL